MKKIEYENLEVGKYCFSCLSKDIINIPHPDKTEYKCLKCGYSDGKIIEIDNNIALTWDQDSPQHTTVGALLIDQKTKKILLMKKKTFPICIDVIAGHLDKNETPEEAVSREVLEETGLKINQKQLLWKGLIKNSYCRRGIPNHFWYLFAANFEGTQKLDSEEVAYLKLYSIDDIKNEKLLNPPIKHILDELGTSTLTSISHVSVGKS
jgi:8-oxo-dGTP pyrophosphatase MutT (NUDIX family)